MPARPEATGELLVLQHDALTGPAGLADLLDSRRERRPWHLVDLGAGEPVPQLAEVAGLLVLGGPMGVADAPEHAWMAAEMALLRDAVAAEVPVLGICLGAQLLATALGGEVTARETPEIAFLALRRTEAAHDDEVFAGWPDGTAALLYHQDQMARLPDGAEPMLEGTTGGAEPRAQDGTDDSYLSGEHARQARPDGVAAWRVGSAHAVQFHPEIDPDLLATWNAQPLFVDELARAGVDAGALLDETRRREPFLRATGLSLVGRWLDGVVG